MAGTEDADKKKISALNGVKRTFNASAYERSTISAPSPIENIFNLGKSSPELQNREVAAMMDEGLFGENTVLAGGVLSRMGATAVKSLIAIEKKDKKAFQELMYQMIMNDALERLNELMAFHLEEMLRLQEEIDEQRRIIGRSQTDQIEINDALEHFRVHGTWPSGCDAQTIINKHRKTHGQLIEANEGDDYLILILLQETLENEERASQETLKDKEREYSHHKLQYDKALTIEKDLSSDDPERRQDALQRLEQLNVSSKIAALTEADTETINNDILEKNNLKEEDLKYSNFTFNYPPSNRP